jgi:hypothetical protein
MTQPSEDPIKALWQGQEPEIPTMTADAIRLMVKNNDAAQRGAVTLGLVAVAVIVGVLTWSAWTATGTLLRIGDLVMLGWAPLVVLYQLRRWPGRSPGAEASAQALIDHHRARIARQLPDLKLVYLSMALVALGLVLVLAGAWQAGQASVAKLGLVGILLAVGVTAIVVMDRAQRRHVARRLRDLDALRG